MGMGMGHHLGLHQSLSHRLEQRLDISLKMEIRPPQDWAAEPDAHTPVQLDSKGRPFVEIKQEHLDAFAGAARMTAWLIHQHRPHSVLVPLRGANPMAHAVRYALTRDPVFQLAELARRKDGSWFTLPRFTRFHSSFFLEGLGEPGAQGVQKAIPFWMRYRARHSPKSDVRFTFLDTSVTGTKHGWYLPQFVAGLRQAEDQIGRRIHLSTVIWSPQEQPRGAPMGAGGMSGRTDIILPHLIAEDSPALLGVPLSERSLPVRSEVSPGALHAYDKIPRADVHVVSPSGEVSVYRCATYGNTFHAFMAAFRTAYRRTKTLATLGATGAKLQT